MNCEYGSKIANHK